MLLKNYAVSTTLDEDLSIRRYLSQGKVATIIMTANFESYKERQ